MQVHRIVVQGSPGILAGQGMVQGGSLGSQGWAAQCWLEILGMAVQGIPEEGIQERMEGGILEL